MRTYLLSTACMDGPSGAMNFDAEEAGADSVPGSPTDSMSCWWWLSDIVEPAKLPVFITPDRSKVV